MLFASDMSYMVSLCGKCFSTGKCGKCDKTVSLVSVTKLAYFIQISMEIDFKHSGDQRLSLDVPLSRIL